MDPRNSQKKKIQPQEIPTRKNFGPTKYHEKKIEPTKYPQKKNFESTKYPREKFWTHEKKLDPRRHGDTKAPDPQDQGWHETHGI